MFIVIKVTGFRIVTYSTVVTKKRWEWKFVNFVTGDPVASKHNA
jgi:hypothetical protein